ncbi:MAG TPA: branched-chain amino acid ABC transporter permease/ATP-binding protein [Amycolatopsis sp.]|nr:branched-chain amino acid ABC transporter permease/ATP-binding protein [Amycolatopsis sp.]
MQHIGFLLLGLGNGAVFAALALALVVTFRSSGVVNFATGAIALYAAYLYAFLRKGELLIPIPGLPKTIDVGGNLDIVPAMLVSMVAAAIFGMLLYVVVFRPLRRHSPVAKAVASIGVMLIIQALLAARVGTQAMNTPAILPKDFWNVADLRIPVDRVWFAVIICLVGVLLTVWFRFTRFGTATRAAAESEKGALVSGLSPERIALVNWAVSSGVAALSGILIAPIVPLIPSSYTLFIVPALAAALVGNFTALGPAIAAALIIGMLQSEIQFLQGQVDWLPQFGLIQLVPLAVILVYLVLRGRPLPSRGAIIQQSLGRAPRPRGLLVPVVCSAVIAVIGLLVTGGGIRAAVITSIIMAVIAISTVVVTGYAGQVSLVQLPLAGVGAFTLNRLAETVGIPFPWAPLLSAIAATAIGVIVGLPALRIRGLPVAVVTLALAVAVESFWFRNTDLNGGINGAPVGPPSLFGLDLGAGAGDAYPRISFGVLCLIVLLVVGIGVALLRRSRLGGAMLAVRANERSAAAAGVDVARTKIIAFAIGAFIAGIGGALLAYLQTIASPDSFTAIGGLSLFATVYIAGATSLAGGVVAGVIAPAGVLYALLDQAFSLGSWYEVIAGAGLVLTVIKNPEGIVGPMHDMVDRIRARFAPPGAAPPAHEPDEPAATRPERVKPEIGEELLRIDGVGVRYGAVVAVDDVSFSVREGEIVGLIGPNGAGKTTLIDAIAGFTPATGRVEFLGSDLAGRAPHRRIRFGLGRTFQGIELYEDLTVEENVAVGREAARHGGTHTADDRDGSLLDRLFDVLRLTPVRGRQVRELSQGRRQLVSVARALAGQPKVVLLDEPAGGLDSTESAWLGERLRAVRDAGVTVVMIDHDMGLVMDVCDRIVVLDLGRVIADGTPAQVRADPAVAKAYLGSTGASSDSASAVTG